MQNLSGKLLIAIPDLGDGNFYRSVVLVFQHDDEGASGVILNRPSEITVGQVCSAPEGGVMITVAHGERWRTPVPADPTPSKTHFPIFG